MRASFIAFPQAIVLVSCLCFWIVWSGKPAAGFHAALTTADWWSHHGSTSRVWAPRLLGLGQDELATIRVFEQASRSVVFITNTAIRRDFWSLNTFEVPQGSGSGFIWDRHGHIVTNFHVVYGADSIEVILADQSSYKATVVGIDPDHDLAVLKIQAPPKKLVPLSIGTSHNLRVGQKVLAIGNPFGLDHTLTTGVVSALGRTIQSINNRTIEGVIQTDAAINPGNSGGPLLDSSGRLIGVNTQIISPSGAYAGIGFAVPVDTVKRVVPQLIQYGKLIRPGIGVSLFHDSLAARWGIRGLIIARVHPGSPAARAGLQGVRQTARGRLKLGDIITKIDGEPVRTYDDLARILDRHTVGDQVTLEVKRDGTVRKLIIRLTAIQ
ncbi:MAG: PDZ domain-containing protein [Nitrospirae bacterium]|nr:MAG: PDZ domain-containing protein [Nitrospirota bacterium]